MKLSGAPVHDLVALYERALSLFRAGDLLEARRLIEQYREPINRQNAPIFSLSAIIDRKEGKISSAIATYSALLEAGITDPGTCNNMANCYREAGDRELAKHYYSRALQQDSCHEDACVNLALLLRSEAALDQAVQLLRAALQRNSRSSRLQHVLSLVLRDLGDLSGAIEAINRALDLAPDDPKLLHLKARLDAESGADSISGYRRTVAADPRNDDGWLGLFVALAENGRAGEGIELLQRRLVANPGWVKGHGALSQLLWQHGRSSEYLDSYHAALERVSQDLNLWIGYFTTLMRSGAYSRVLCELDRVRKLFGCLALFDRYQACCASETGDLLTARRLFTTLDVDGDDELAIVWIRQLIREKRFDEAARSAENLADQRVVSAWSYLTILWRLTGDSRLDWLESLEESVCVTSADLDSDELNDIAAAVRACHTAVKHPYDQSMRGGTQTDGSLLNRIDPRLALLKEAILQQIDTYTHRLSHVSSFSGSSKGKRDQHPFFRFADKEAHLLASYSVLLQDNGFHVSHMHPHTWISCCLYLETPPSIGADESKPDGWFALGRPPAELGLDLAARKFVKPEPGRLVIFPSFLWHGTTPYRSGQRLSVVCDLTVRQ